MLDLTHQNSILGVKNEESLPVLQITQMRAFPSFAKMASVKQAR